MSGEAQLLLVIAGMHVFGLVCAAALLIPALRSPDNPLRRDGGSDGGGGSQRPQGPSSPSAPDGGLPLPDAAPARIRLRDHRRPGALIPGRERRPAREPERVPERVQQG